MKTEAKDEWTRAIRYVAFSLVPLSAVSLRFYHLEALPSTLLGGGLAMFNLWSIGRFVFYLTAETDDRETPETAQAPSSTSALSSPSSSPSPSPSHTELKPEVEWSDQKKKSRAISRLCPCWAC